LAWLYANPFPVDDEGKPITERDGQAIRVPVQFFREDSGGKPMGSPVLGYLTMDGITPATAPKPLKNIENL
jgi:hypothetical protein